MRKCQQIGKEIKREFSSPKGITISLNLMGVGVIDEETARRFFSEHHNSSL